MGARTTPDRSPTHASGCLKRPSPPFNKHRSVAPTPKNWVGPPFFAALQGQLCIWFGLAFGTGERGRRETLRFRAFFSHHHHHHPPLRSPKQQHTPPPPPTSFLSFSPTSPWGNSTAQHSNNVLASSPDIAGSAHPRGRPAPRPAGAVVARRPEDRHHQRRVGARRQEHCSAGTLGEHSLASVRGGGGGQLICFGGDGAFGFGGVGGCGV